MNRWPLVACVVLIACAHAPVVVADDEPVVPFAEGMTRPVFDEESRFAEAYTAEDRAAGTQGMVIVACDVLRSGVVKRCQLIKGLPGVGPRLLELMETLHAKPATRQGQPVSVRYLKVFNFQPRPM